eukprot:632681_1
MTSKKSYTAIRKIMLDALNSQSFADTTFIIGEQQSEYHINRIFLALISPVFKAMLFGKMTESQPNSTVVIEDTTPKTFESIIRFAYCNPPNITEHNVLSIIQFCDKYQITSLNDICHEYFQSKLTAKNFCTYCYKTVQLKLFKNETAEILNTFLANHWRDCLNTHDFWTFFAVMFDHHHSRIVDQCKTFLQHLRCHEIQTMLAYKEFYKLSVKQIRWILTIEPFQCPEEILWAVLLQWAGNRSKMNHKKGETSVDYDEKANECSQFQKESEYKIYLLKSVRDLVRFGLMKGEYFANYVASEKVLNDKELISVLLYYQAPEKGCGRFNTKVRSRIQKKGKSLEYTYKSSVGRNVKRCVTNLGGPVQSGGFNNEFIQATFRKPVFLTKMEIGTNCANQLSEKKLEIQKVHGWGLEGDQWHDVMQLPLFQKNEIQTFQFKTGTMASAVTDFPNVKNAYLIMNKSVGVGQWRDGDTKFERY